MEKAIRITVAVVFLILGNLFWLMLGAFSSSLGIFSPGIIVCVIYTAAWWAIASFEFKS
jgi:uncharacterized membrane protein YccF (DUF307 family)